MNRYDANGKGEYVYDGENDILLFKIRDRDYARSLEFENMVVDLDEKGFIMGVRFFDASQLFRVEKSVLGNVSGFEFRAGALGNVVRVELRFEIKRKGGVERLSENFTREAQGSLQDSEVVCSA